MNPPNTTKNRYDLSSNKSCSVGRKLVPQYLVMSSVKSCQRELVLNVCVTNIYAGKWDQDICSNIIHEKLCLLQVFTARGFR